MPQKRNTKSVWLILSVCLTLSACSSVELKDNEWCGDIGELGAACFHTLSDKQREIPKAEWDAYRVGLLCTNSDSFANWKAAILKLCQETKRCTKEQIQTVETLDRKVKAFRKKAKP